MPRLRSELRVKAMLRQADAVACPGAVLRRGDPDAGGILVLLRGRDGIVLLSEASGPEGEAVWMRASETPLDEAETEERVARARARDPDLWVVELESPGYTLPFEGRIS